MIRVHCVCNSILELQREQSDLGPIVIVSFLFIKTHDKYLKIFLCKFKRCIWIVVCCVSVLKKKIKGVNDFLSKFHKALGPDLRRQETGKTPVFTNIVEIVWTLIS